MGGLGSQLFQYVAARQIAQRLRTTLKLDVTSFASDPLRTDSLHPFRIHEQFAGQEDRAVEIVLPKNVGRDRGKKFFDLRALRALCGAEITTETQRTRRERGDKTLAHWTKGCLTLQCHCVGTSPACELDDQTRSLKDLRPTMVSCKS